MTRQESHRGRLLVATPDLSDPNFARTVVLVLEHTADGALGLVLNRPGATAVEAVARAWAPLAVAPPVAFVGGPVGDDGVITLARVTRLPPCGAEVVRGVTTIDLADEPARHVDTVEAIRVFAGYAGWGPGQLDDEVAAGGWFLATARAEDPFTTEPDGLWSAVLRRQPGRLAWFAHCPPDPSSN